MTLPSSGSISMSQVNTELGLSASAVISLNQANVRNLAAVPSGAISLANLRGKSNLQVITFDNAGGGWGSPQDWNLWNILVYLGIAVTSQNVQVVLTNITINASATSIPALETGNGWPAGTNLEVVLGSGCVLNGKGGAGGAGATTVANGGAGGAGGPAYRVTGAISGGTIKSTISGGLVRAGGGGGGGGGCNKYVGNQDQGTYYVYGGAGGTGFGPGAATAGSPGQMQYTNTGGRGGDGGGSGSAGASGAGGNYRGPGGGGAGGAAIVNAALSTNVNWVAGTTYFGSVA